MTNQDFLASNTSSDLFNNSGFIPNPLSEDPAVLPKTGGGETELGNYGAIDLSIPIGTGNNLYTILSEKNLTGLDIIPTKTEENYAGKSISPGLAVENNILHTQPYQALRFPSPTRSISTISITANDSKAGEVIDGKRANSGKFTVIRKGDLTSPITVDYAITGSATNGVDYENLHGQIYFAAGVSRNIINLNVNNDGIVEDTETVTLSLNSSSQYLLGTKTTATVNITDNDKSRITIRANDRTAGETITGQRENPGKITLRRRGDLISSTTVNYTLSGTATNGVDYENLDGSVTFAAGSSTAVIDINVINDNVLESGETLVITLADSEDYTLTRANTARVNIVDNDKPLITIRGTDRSGKETLPGQKQNLGKFTFTRKGDLGSSTIVNYNLRGTARNGTDYQTIPNNITFAAGESTKTIDITPIDDNLYEGTETIVASLTSSQDYSLSKVRSATVNLLDNDKPTIKIRASDRTAQETLNAQAANPGKFTLFRNGNRSQELTVYYKIAGTATNGIDYESIINHVTFAAGSATTTVDINPLDDFALEGNETISLSLQNRSNYLVDKKADTATITLKDNDSGTPVKPTITISASDSNAGEILTGETQNPGRFTLTRTAGISSPLTVNYTLGGTAVNGVDYSSLSGSVSFAAGASTAVINVNPIDDGEVEGDESVTVSLVADNGYVLGGAKTGNLTIFDNDSLPIVTVSATDVDAAETSNGQTVNTGQFTLTRTGDLSNGLTVNYAVSGTATNGVDYNSLSGSVSFAADASSTLINVNPIDDGEVEGDETVILTLQADNSYILGENTSSIVHIAGSNFGNHLEFDGVNDFVSITLDEPETEVTHEFRFKTTDADAGLFSVVDSNLGYGGHDRHIYLSGGNIKARLHSREEIESTGLNLADGNWHHVAHVFGASIGGQKLYIDGQLVASGSKTTSDFDWQQRINIGFSQDATNKRLNGSIDEVRIWNKARTQSEISADLDHELTGNEAGLIGYWKFNEITDNTAVDSSNGQNDGKLFFNDINHTGLINDINKDGKHDILWRNYNNGETLFWSMDGGTRLGGVDIPDYLDMAWHPVAMADFNNDGNLDIVWRYHWLENTGYNRIWLMDGNTRLAEVGIDRVIHNDWHIVGSGDFNNDGNADILWRHYRTGDNQIWHMRGTERIADSFLDRVTDLNQRIVGTGDFNGDGKSDILWRDAKTGKLYIWFMDGTTKSSVQNLSSSPDLTWTVGGTGDMNNDGKSDIIWRNLNTGDNAVWLMNGSNKLADLDIEDVPQLNWNLVGDSDIIPIWTAEYFGNKDLARTPTSTEGFINITGGFSKNWGAGAPPNTPVDNFSARFTTQQYFAPGLHRINISADDSVRVWVDNKLVINSWATLAGDRLEYFYSDGGFSPVRVEYKEETGAAGINFEVVKHQPYDTFGDGVGLINSWNASFYTWNGETTPILEENHRIGTVKLTGNVRSDGKWGMDLQNWGVGSPASDVPVDHFAMHTYTRRNLEAGHTYKVWLKSDDGYRIWAHKLGGGAFNITDNAVGGTWQTEAYISGREFTFKAPESGTFDFHVQMYEDGGNAYFELVLEDVTPPTGYHSGLNTLSESQWDQQSGDNTQFEANPYGGGGDQRWKTDDRIEQIYTDLSHAIFGSRVAMTAGYAYDQSYYNGRGKWHAGIDMNAANGTTIKAAIGGSVAWVSGSGDGYVFVGINSDDGRQWVYGHLKSTSGLWSGKRINAGDTVGLIGYYGGASHLHLEVENGHAYGETQGAMTNQSTLLNVTVSPLMAYWQWRNRDNSGGGSTQNETDTFTYGSNTYTWVTYTIRSGDSLSAIAQRTIGDSSANGYNFIAEHNNIADPSRISIGQVIEIPELFNNSTSSGSYNLNNIPNIWKPAATSLIPTLVKAFKDQGITNSIVLAFAAASIGRESSWNPNAVNTTDIASQTGYPGAGLAQVTWKNNYIAVGNATGIDFLNHPEYMFDPYKSLRAKAAYYQLNNMISYIESGDYQSAAGIYNAGSSDYRSTYTRNVALDTEDWKSVFS